LIIATVDDNLMGEYVHKREGFMLGFGDGLKHDV